MADRAIRHDGDAAAVPVGRGRGGDGEVGAGGGRRLYLERARELKKGLGTCRRRGWMRCA